MSLPLEKCLELRDAGFTCEALSVSPVDRFHEYDHRQLVFIPSGDELLAECRKLLKTFERIERTTFQDGRSTVYILNGLGLREYPNGATITTDEPQPDNSDLADLWKWLNERKKRND